MNFSREGSAIFFYLCEVYLIHWEKKTKNSWAALQTKIYRTSTKSLRKFDFFMNQIFFRPVKAWNNFSTLPHFRKRWWGTYIAFVRSFYFMSGREKYINVYKYNTCTRVFFTLSSFFLPYLRKEKYHIFQIFPTSL